MKKKNDNNKIITSLKTFLKIKMSSLVNGSNLISFTLTFDIKNIESKLTSASSEPNFNLSYFSQSHSNSSSYFFPREKYHLDKLLVMLIYVV